jgi:hypothetical protein
LVAAAFVIGGGGTAPTVSTIADTGTSLASGSTAGNRPVTITGSNFIAGATVAIGGVQASNVVVVSGTQGTQITCRTGPHAAAANVAVAVTTSNGAGSANLYTYTLALHGSARPAQHQRFTMHSVFRMIHRPARYDTTLTKRPGFAFTVVWLTNAECANAGAV